MNKRVLFKGKEVLVTYKGLEVGKNIVNFRAVNKNLEDFNLEDYKGKVIVINTFPSIDTGICALQTIRFNKEIKDYSDVVVVTISKDLPFALGRFCGEKGIDNVITVSDYKYRDFEEKLGGFIPDLGLLSRQVIVVDKESVVQYLELVEEVSSEPNYEKALEVVKNFS